MKLIDSKPCRARRDITNEDGASDQVPTNRYSPLRYAGIGSVWTTSCCRRHTELSSWGSSLLAIRLLRYSATSQTEIRGQHLPGVGNLDERSGLKCRNDSSAETLFPIQEGVSLSDKQVTTGRNAGA